MADKNVEKILEMLDKDLSDEKKQALLSSLENKGDKELSLDDLESVSGGTEMDSLNIVIKYVKLAKFLGLTEEALIKKYEKINSGFSR